MNLDQNRANNTDLAFKLVFTTALTALSVYLAYQLKVLIVILILAVTLASAMAPIAEAAEKKKIPRALTVGVIYVVGLLCYTTLGAMLAPTVHEQWHKLNDNLPSYTTSVNLWYQKALNLAGTNSEALVPSAETLRNLGMKALNQTMDMSAGLVGLVLNTALTLFLSGYFVVEANDIWKSILAWLPPPVRSRVESLIVPVGGRMGGYVRGQLLVAACVALFLAVGFSLLGIKYALVLGMLAGLLNLVPFVGSFIACAFAVVVALNQAPVLALLVILLYAVEQWVESTFMVPFFVGRQADLHPLVVLLAVIVGATLLGVPGALISVPLASAGILLAEELYVKPLNGASSQSAPDPEADSLN